MRHFLLPLPLVLLLNSLVVAQKKCYAFDGKTVAGAPDYKPCIAIAGVDSMCCALNRTAADLDTCAGNGLCLSQGTYFRDYCTDPTWQSPNCIPKAKACSKAQGGSDDGTVVMTLCTDGSWCCGANNNTNCCDKNLGFRLENQLVKFGSATIINDTTPTNNTTNCTAPPLETEPAKKNTITMSIGVGVGVGVAGIIGILAAFWFGRKRGRKQIANKGAEGIGMFNVPGSVGSQDIKAPMLPYDAGHTTQFQNQPPAMNTSVSYSGHAPIQQHQHIQEPQEIGSVPMRAELGTGERRF